jgi:hypothetical protein
MRPNLFKRIFGDRTSLKSFGELGTKIFTGSDGLASRRSAEVGGKSYPVNHQSMPTITIGGSTPSQKISDAEAKRAKTEDKTRT